EIALITAVSGNWPMYGGDSAHTSLQLMAGAMNTAPIVKWSFTASGFFWLTYSGIADCDGDGMAEVLASCDDGKIYCLPGASGTPAKWSFTAGGSNGDCSPAIADVDGDGQQEVITTGNSKVYRVNGATGLQEQVFSTSGNTDYSSPLVADLDADGQKEVVVGAGSNVYCINGPAWTQEWVYTTGNLVNSSPALADVDGNGTPEVVVGSADNKIYCLNNNGTLRWTLPTSGMVLSSPAAADLFAGDGGKEEVVIAGYSDTLYCLVDTVISGNDTCKLRWKVFIGNIADGTPAIADVDGDGQKEVLVGNGTDDVYCFDGATGTQEWARMDLPIGNSARTLFIADIDGNGDLEAVIGSDGGQIICLNAESGTTLWQKSMGVAVRAPFPGDIDGDGRIEIVVGTTTSNIVYALDDNNPTYGGENEEPGGNETIGFRAIGTSLYLFLSSGAMVSLSLYDASGRLVQNLYDGVLSAGTHTFVPDIKAAGVYLVVLRSNNDTRTVKFIR
ncbi:MAG: FG-GAP-like repeat-containing protein, partial [Candidatus Hydrothermia bacterium]